MCHGPGFEWFRTLGSEALRSWVLESGREPMWEFPRIGVPYFGVLIIGSYYLGYSVRVPCFRKPPCRHVKDNRSGTGHVKRRELLEFQGFRVVDCCFLVELRTRAMLLSKH